MVQRMDKAVLTFIVVAVVDSLRGAFSWINGKALVGLVAVFGGAGVGVADALLEGTPLRAGAMVGVAVGVAAYGGVTALDRHADRQAPSVVTVNKIEATATTDQKA